MDRNDTQHNPFKIGDKVNHAGYVFEVIELMGYWGIGIKHRRGECVTSVEDVTPVPNDTPAYGW